jgi:hypothetical protein
MDEFLSILLSPTLQFYLLPLKIIFWGLGLFFATFLIYLIVETKWFRFLIWYDLVEFFTQRHYGAASASRHWKRIARHIENSEMKDHANVVTAGHEIMDNLLEKMVPMYQCQTYGDRLARLGPETFSNITDIWEAHELWRKIQRENYFPTPDEIKKTFDTYQKAFEELEII